MAKCVYNWETKWERWYWRPDHRKKAVFLCDLEITSWLIERRFGYIDAGAGI